MILGGFFLSLLVLSHYLYAAGVCTVITVSLLREKYRNKKNLFFLGMVCLLGLLSASWVLIGNAYAVQRVAESGIEGHLFKFFRLMWMAPRDSIRFEFFPVGMLLFAAVGMLAASRSTSVYARNIGLALAYGLGCIVSVSFFSIQTPASTAIDADMRYYILLIPIAAVIAAQTFELLWESRLRVVAPLFLVVLISSNVLTGNFAGRIGLHSRMLQYLGEVMNDYTTGSEAISQYIDLYISPEECVFMVPMYANFIQMYHHPEQKFCGLVSNQTPFAKKHAGELRKDLFWENAVPDYVIVGRHPAHLIARFLGELYGEGGYVLEAVIPIFWGNMTRPEIPWRIFAPVQIQTPLNQGVLIFRRTDKAQPPKMSGLEVEKYLLY